MTLQGLATAELSRRVELLPREVATWTAAARANVNLLGIHGSQLFALAEMMDVLQSRLQAMLPSLADPMPAADFSKAYFDALREVAGAQGLWHVFRTILMLRTDPTLGPAVDAADLVAADCYKSCIDRVREWGLIDEKRLREPPLVALEAGESAVTVSRGESVEFVGPPLKLHRAQKLPIPIVLLPFDHVGCVWLWCSIHHEVGHNLDQDLGLANELAQLTDQRLNAAGVSWERKRLWGLWGEEILADAFGVLLGGAGYGHFSATLFPLLANLRPALNPQDPHPHEAVRLRLLAAMLTRGGVASWISAADAILDLPILKDAPAELQWTADWSNDAKFVSEVYLDSPLVALGNRPLRELVPDPTGDSKLSESLVEHLHIGYIAPDPGTVAVPFHWKAVPVAAQLALLEAQRAGMDMAVAMQGIHERALKFLKRIPRPTWLSKPQGAASKEAIRELSANIRLSTLFR